MQEPFISFEQKSDVMANKLDKFTCSIQLPATALKLRSLRRKKGLSIENIADACNIAFNDLFMYELGKKQPNKIDFEKILEFLS